MGRRATALAAFAVLPFLASSSRTSSPKPHIITYLIDDMGWYDTQPRNPDSSMTGHFAELAGEGIVLERHHAYKVCSPSRRSFLSGRFPVSVGGSQAHVCDNTLPLQFTLLPAKLKQAGYETHMIGKGHLGYQTTDHLPINRGFDTHIGYLWGEERYHNGAITYGEPQPYDMWEDDHPAGLELVGEIYYSTNFYTERAIQRLRGRDQAKPFYLHLTYQAVHSPYSEPPEWERQNDTTFWSQTYGDMLYVLNAGLANITAELRTQGMWENTLLVLVSDNGGGPIGGAEGFCGGNAGPCGANNHGLRGRKGDDWEGGTRTNDFISGGVIPEHLRGTSSHALVHIADWYPTLSRLAGVDPTDVAHMPKTHYFPASTHDIDGVDAWPRLMGTNMTNPRPFVPTTDKAILWENDGTMYKYYTSAGAAFRTTPNNTYIRAPPCDATGGCLFDVMADPEEWHDIAASKPDIVDAMRAQLGTYSSYVTWMAPEETARYECDGVARRDGRHSTGLAAYPRATSYLLERPFPDK